MTTTVVVTGLGIAAPNGLGTQDYWAATRTGKNGIGRVTRFDPSSYPRPSRARCPASSPRTCCRAGCCRRPTT